MPAALYLCIHLRDFAAQALAREHKLGSRALTILSGTPPLERVFAMNAAARQQGMVLGMSRVQAESFSITLLRRDRECEDSAFAELESCAERFSPRVEAVAAPCEEYCGATLMLDISGSERLLGRAQKIASTVHRAVREVGFEASVVTSHNACTALLAARGLPDASAIASGDEARTLAPLSLDVLQLNEAQAETLDAWGIHTLGELAALPSKALAARMGADGARLQAEARGTASHLLVPDEAATDAPLRENLELEHPVELLEPLLFLLSQMLETLLQRAGTRSLAIASVETCLVLDGASNTGARAEHRRVVRPTLPERDRLTLLKLMQLDLELHPPVAAVIALRLTAHPARPQTAQQGLFAAQAPEAGRMGVLLARLRKLVGEDRVGAPELLDTHAPEDFRVTGFEIGPALRSASAELSPHHASALRMVRPPRAVAVDLCSETPVAMRLDGRREMLRNTSGPWRTSGAWWTPAPAAGAAAVAAYSTFTGTTAACNSEWCREEWDVVLQDEPQRCLRLAHDPSAGCWYLIGIYD
jgi:protein ImuB